MLYRNAMEVALFNAGLITKIRKPRKLKNHTFPCHKCKGIIETIPYTNVATCMEDKCDNYIIFN